MAANPYILWLYLDAAAARAIEELYKSSEGTGQVDAGKFMAAFRSKTGNKRVVIEHNAQRCESIERFYTSFFSIERK